MLFNISTVFFDISLSLACSLYEEALCYCIFNIISIFTGWNNDGKENIWIELVYNFEKQFLSCKINATSNTEIHLSERT